MADNAEAVEEISRHLAAYAVRRKCNQHACPAAGGETAICDHLNHPRDVDYLTEHLAMLGLDGSVPDVTENDRRALLKAMAHGSPRTDLSDL